MQPPARLCVSAVGRRAAPAPAPVTTKFASSVRGSYQDADDWYGRGAGYGYLASTAVVRRPVAMS
jgi:hypothetical protein